MRRQFIGLLSIIALLAVACGEQKQDSTKENPTTQHDSTLANDPDIENRIAELPEPYATKSVTKRSDEIGWLKDKAPTAPAGFSVKRFAEELDNPRWMYEGPNGDIFVSLAQTRGKSENTVLLFRDTNNDGMPDAKFTFAEGLNKPLGMLILNGYFYIANTDETLRWPYKVGQTKLEGKGESILATPPLGYNNHWTRNLLASTDGKKIYVSVGSGSNVGENGMEHEQNRANIIQINPDGSGKTIYAYGLRNPVGMDWQPGTNILWTAVNERDELGDELVPDYLTSVKQGGFYGWPYSYYGQNEDPRRKGERPDLVKQAIVPDVPLGSHTASLGLAFYDQKAFPEKYRNGAFIGQHGSWNRSTFSGYAVVFVPFSNGKPGKPENFLTGFIADEAKSEVYGRPVGTYVTSKGTLLVADDTGGIIWAITANK